MAHYAVLDENNVVIQVIKGRDEDEVVDGISDWEQWYSDFFKKPVKRTSYNTIAGEHSKDGTPFRKNYAGIDYTYDESRDAFIPPKPYPSWILNEDTCRWQAPTTNPENGTPHIWNEESQSWEEVAL